MQRVHSSTILILTALVLCIQGVCSHPDRDLNQNQDLEMEVRHHQLLQHGHGAGLLPQVRQPKNNGKYYSIFFLQCSSLISYLFKSDFSLKV